MSDEERGFTVKDRRLFAEDGSQRDTEEPEAQAESAPAPEAQGEAEADRAADAARAFADTEKADQAKAAAGRQARQLPPVEFSGLVLSLAHAALLHLGQIPGPDGQPAPPDFALARHTIDTIAMLQEKTKGNLSKDERELIDTSLTDLRMVFVKLHG